MKADKKKLTKQGLLLSVAGLVLVVVLISLGVAWYTRVSNTYSVTFEVADYDLAVNQNVEDQYLLNIYQYSVVKNQKMAPGTTGYIPLEISTYHSEVSVAYNIQLNTKMPIELQKRIRMYYLVRTEMVEGSEEDYEIAKVNADETTSYYKTKTGATAEVVYGDAWNTTTELDKTFAGYVKSETVTSGGTSATKYYKYERVYLDFNKTDSLTGAEANEVETETESGGSVVKTTVTDGESPVIRDTLEYGQDVDTYMLCLYWEWYIDAQDASEHGSPYVSGQPDSTATKSLYDAYIYEASGVDGIDGIWTKGAWTSYNSTSKTWNRATWTYNTGSGTWTAPSGYHVHSDAETTDCEACAYAKAWDDYDTDIGRYPEKYEDAFTMYINTSGSQVVPAQGNKITTTTTTAAAEPES